MKTISTEDLRDRMFTVKSKDQGVTEVDDTSNLDNQGADVQEVNTPNTPKIEPLLSDTRETEVVDQEEFHLVHVSEGHFDCLNCHEEIKHGDLSMAEQLLTSTNCTTCHGGKRHSVQEGIYAGTALLDLDPMPDVMYEAGVACDGGRHVGICYRNPVSGDQGLNRSFKGRPDGLQKIRR